MYDFQKLLDQEAKIRKNNNKKYEDTVMCTSCNGEGEIVMYGYHQDDWEPHEIYSSDPCASCDSKGWNSYYTTKFDDESYLDDMIQLLQKQNIKKLLQQQNVATTSLIFHLIDKLSKYDMPKLEKNLKLKAKEKSSTKSKHLGLGKYIHTSKVQRLVEEKTNIENQLRIAREIRSELYKAVKSLFDKIIPDKINEIKSIVIAQAKGMGYDMKTLEKALKAAYRIGFDDASEILVDLASKMLNEFGLNFKVGDIKQSITENLPAISLDAQGKLTRMKKEAQPMGKFFFDNSSQKGTIEITTRVGDKRIFDFSLGNKQ